MYVSLYVLYYNLEACRLEHGVKDLFKNSEPTLNAWQNRSSAHAKRYLELAKLWAEEGERYSTTKYHCHESALAGCRSSELMKGWRYQEGQD